MAHGHNGLTPGEAAVMDLWDAGKGSREIARVLRQPHGKVTNIMTLYARDEQRSDNAAIAAGSANLLDALRRARPEQVA